MLMPPMHDPVLHALRPQTLTALFRLIRLSAYTASSSPMISASATSVSATFAGVNSTPLPTQE